MWRHTIPICLALTLALPCAASDADASPDSPGLCDLIRTDLNPSHPTTRKGAFRKALSSYHNGQWAKAAERFARAFATIRTQARSVFHPASQGDRQNKDAQGFLTHYVYASPPAVMLGTNAFHFAPKANLAAAESHCRARQYQRAADVLSAWQQPQISERSIALAALLAHLGSTATAEALLPHFAKDASIEARIARALVLHSSGKANQAGALIDQARTTCAGPTQCSLVEWAGATVAAPKR